MILNFLGVDTTTGQYKPFLPGTDKLNFLDVVSSNTTTEGFLLTAASLTSGSFLKGVVPSSGFTGNIIDIKDNAGSPANKFIVDATGKITTGSADTSLLTSGTLGIARGGTGLGTIASGKLLYASATDTLSALTLGGTLSITTGTISVVADSVVQQVRVSKGGTLTGTRREINLIEGSNISLTMADDTPNNRVNVTIAASGSAGSKWSDLTDPTADLSLSMGGNLTTLTWGNATSTNDMFSIKDTASNTGTGYVMSINTASSSTAKPIRITAQELQTA